MLRNIGILLSFFLSVEVANAQLVINELMQSNIDCVMDDINEFPDSWVELYNGGSLAVSLGQYSIGLTADASSAWKLPSSVTVPVHGRVLVYCDKESKDMHTDFRLDSGKGGAVYLFKGNAVADYFADIPKQPSPNIAYGRQKDGGTEIGYQAVPTPKAANCGTIYKKTLGAPVFSQRGRVFEGSTIHNYTVALSLPNDAPEGTEIRYTLDGSEPTEQSALYTAPLNYATTKVIRAKLFCKGYLSPRSSTESFIVHPRLMTLPVVSIVTDSKYFYDNKIGIYVDGNYNSSTKNYQYDWRRPINFEYYEEPAAVAALNQLCETRISGGASRGAKYKSLAIYANKRFGEKHFKYEFFPDQRPGLTKYKSLVLRNAGNDFDYLFMRDAIAQRSVGQQVDLDWQAWKPAVVYINGKYMGMLNIRERGNESNVYTNYDGLEDVDGVENWYSLKEGDMTHLNAFKSFFSEHGHTWAEYSEWMDVDEYINLVIMNCYYNNVDFFGNNLFMWRPRAEGGRWRFIAKDVDYIAGLYGQCKYNYEYLKWIYDQNYDSSLNWANTSDATRLFRRLMEDKDFKRRFIDRMAVYMGTFLNYSHIWENVWQPMYEKIKYEYPSHRALINQWWPNYNNEMTSMQTWLQKRTDFMYKHLADYFQLGAIHPLVINNKLTEEERSAADFTFNEVRLSDGTFTGKFYEDREVTLSGKCKDKDRQVVGWQILTAPSKGLPTYSTVSGDVCTFTMPACTSVIVNAIYGSYDGIDAPSAHGPSSAVTGIYDATGCRHAVLQPGLNIVRTPDGIKKIRR